MKKKIMIVDDNPSVVYSVKEGLRFADPDFEVIGCEGGEQCFEVLRSGEKPDLIILDIMMPGMNGWDVFAELDKNLDWKNIPVVFLTAKSDSYSKGFGKLACQDYIEKPFEINDLKERINKILGQNNA
jgi:CheY-like chemotaxis protein